MNIRSEFNPVPLRKCADTSRDYIADCHFDGKSLKFTNGHFAVEFPVVADEIDTPGRVPFVALESARKAAGRNGPVVVLANDSVKVPMAEIDYKRPTPEKEFPDLSFAYPPADKFVAGRITINTKYLAAIARAFGTDVVTIETGEALDTLDPLVCRVSNAPDARILLMPVRA